jgi:hypothetical protein
LTRCARRGRRENIGSTMTTLRTTGACEPGLTSLSRRYPCLCTLERCALTFRTPMTRRIQAL